MKKPKVGEIVDNYRFKGGNANDPNNWEPITTPQNDNGILGFLGFPDLSNKTAEERMYLNPINRFAIGAVDPLLRTGAKAIQGITGYFGQPSPISDATLAFLNQYQKRKNEILQGEPDIAGAAGEFVPAGLAGKTAATLLPFGKAGVPQELTKKGLGELAAYLLGKTARGAARGAVAGAAGYGVLTQSTEPTDYVNPALMGGLFGVGMEGVKGAAQTLKSRFTVPEIFRRAIQADVGEKDIPIIAKAIVKRQKTFSPPKERVTVAQALASVPVKSQGKVIAQGLPQGTVLQSLQKRVAESPRGVSSQFAKEEIRALNHLRKAEALRDQVTAPLREKAFQAIRQAGGVDVQPIMRAVDAIFKAREMRGLPNANRAKSMIKRLLQQAQNQELGGKADPESLYNIRRSIYRGLTGDDVKWDKATALKADKLIQKTIDQAYTKAGGGKAWEKYLRTFRRYSKKIDMDRAAYEAKYKPIQPSYSEEIPRDKLKGEFTSYLPFILEREGTIARWLLTSPLASRMEPHFDRLTAAAFRNPQLMAKILQSQRGITPYYQRFDRIAPIGSGIIGAKFSNQER